MGKATAVLKGERPAPVDDASTADMKSKHPNARPSEAARCGGLRPVAAAAALAALPEDVFWAVKSFPEGSAGGMSGPKHQQQSPNEIVRVPQTRLTRPKKEL